MIEFLKIVAAFFVALALVAAAIYFWLRYKISRWVENMTDQLTHGLGVIGPAGAFLIPLRIHLEETADADWVDYEALQDATDQLTTRGFELISDYDIEPAGIAARGLLNRDEAIYGVIYQHPLMDEKTWVDLFTPYADGTSVTFSTSADGTLLDPPPGIRRQVFVEDSASQLFERMLRTRPDAERAQVSAERFARDFEDYYAREMDWRIERGGPSRGEIERAAAKADAEVTDELVRQIHELWSAHVAEHQQAILREKFPECANLSSNEYRRVRDRLIFIHDGMTSEMLFESIENCLPYPDEDDGDEDGYALAEAEYERMLERAARLAEHKPPREAFSEFIRTLPDQNLFEHLQSIDAPVAADVYVGPERWE